MNRRAMLAATLGGALILVPGCGRGNGGAGTDPQAKPAVIGSSGQLPAITGAATTIEGLAAVDYADYYAGLEVAAGGITVFRKPGDGLDAAVRAAVPGVPITFRDASHSRKELNALVQRLLADRDYWAGQGVPLWTVGARHDGSGVEVGTSAGDKLLAAAPGRYGSAPIIVVAMSSAPSAVPLNP